MGGARGIGIVRPDEDRGAPDGRRGTGRAVDRHVPALAARHCPRIQRPARHGSADGHALPGHAGRVPARLRAALRSLRSPLGADRRPRPLRHRRARVRFRLHHGHAHRRPRLAGARRGQRARGGPRRGARPLRARARRPRPRLHGHRAGPHTHPGARARRIHPRGLGLARRLLRSGGIRRALPASRRGIAPRDQHPPRSHRAAARAALAEHRHPAQRQGVSRLCAGQCPHVRRPVRLHLGLGLRAHHPARRLPERLRTLLRRRRRRAHGR